MASGRLLPITILLLLSGCTGEPGASTGASTSPSVIVPTHGVDTGSIGGTVTDEELQPVAGATVALLRQEHKTTTLANGSFAFANLQPGSHTLFVQALGYETASRRVEVRVGETTRGSIALPSIAVSGEVYFYAVPRTIVFNLEGPWSIDATEGPYYVNVSTLNDIRCSPCSGVLHFAPGASGAQSELKWTGTYISPVTNTMIMKYVRNWTSETGLAAPGTSVNRPILANGAKAVWAETAIKELKKAGDRVKLFVTIPRDSVAINVKVETWTSFWYNGPVPDEYSAFPPPS